MQGRYSRKRKDGEEGKGLAVGWGSVLNPAQSAVVNTTTVIPPVAAAAAPLPAAAGAGPPPAAAAGAGPLPAAAVAAPPPVAAAAGADSDDDEDDDVSVSSSTGGGAAKKLKKAKIKVVFPQVNFKIKNRRFFVERFSSEGPASARGRGFWIAPYFLKAINDPMGGGDFILVGTPWPDRDVGAPLGTAASGVVPPPSVRAIPYEHYIPADAPTPLFTVGAAYLRMCLEAAEEADRDFALRMQGLQNCALGAVWSCPDDANEGKDREDASRRYAERYVRRFLESCGVSGETKSSEVAKETLQMQRDFAEGWTNEHTHTLSPLVESSGEALVTMFISSSLSNLRGLNMTAGELFRALRRNKEFAAQLGLCLHHFMVKLEQDRGGRNANYKSMFNASTSNLLALGALAKSLGAGAAGIYDTLSRAMRADPFFHPLLVDWHGIFRQMPVVRSEYPGFKQPLAAA